MPSRRLAPAKQSSDNNHLQQTSFSPVFGPVPAVSVLDITKPTINCSPELFQNLLPSFLSAPRPVFTHLKSPWLGNSTVLSSHKKNKKWSKLEPRGGLGTLVGFNQEIKSYRILTEEGIIINSKSVDFLEFLPAEKLLTEDNELVVKEKVRTPEKAGVSEKEGEDTVVKEEEDEEELPELEEENSNLDEDLNSDNDVMIADSLIPKTDEPVGCILRDRTLQVQPLKYSHLLEDPMSFKKAVTCSKAEGWTKAIDEELENIEQHQVWLDQMEK
ncbi:hypothetical protein PGTUg99_033462 [Puccinia graminis f. sp. tritici]|uniref:Uncharacterized protein n=1 Tax=Puccinia graminis f. sp. tritici TaxID=56615 RepID=A0A5B0N2H9_PUCGR|nr:hypothetical protein PGTUg99_033462 [Puccinia graminis f. sp. tritici]